jgi:hypothetical protein
MTYSPEYNSYNAMKQRCYYPRHKDYAEYGGRGIAVCDRWLASFENFYKDIGPKPSQDHSVDRIDPNGDYTPENTRWANRFVQSRTRRNTIRVNLPDGRNVTLKEAADYFGANYDSVRYAVHDCHELPLSACERLGAGQFKKPGTKPRR